MVKLTAPVTFGEQQVLPLINDFMLQHDDVEAAANQYSVNGPPQYINSFAISPTILKKTT